MNSPTIQKDKKIDPEKWSEKNNDLAKKAFDKWKLEKGSNSSQNESESNSPPQSQ